MKAMLSFFEHIWLNWPTAFPIVTTTICLEGYFVTEAADKRFIKGTE